MTEDEIDRIERQGDVGHAREAFSQALLAAPQDNSLRRRVSRALHRMGASEAALETLGPAAVQSGLDLERVVILIATQRLSDAERALADAAAAYPTHPALPVRWGLLHYALGRHSEAAAAYREALRLNPSDHRLRPRAARCLLRMGAATEALSVLDDGLAADPQQAGLLIARASALQALGRLDDVEATLARVAELEPNHPALATTRAKLASERGDHDTAVDAYRVALSAQPKDTALRVRLARSLHRGRKLHEALAVLDVGLANEPAHLELGIERVGILRQIGRLAEAEEMLAQIISREPSVFTVLLAAADLAQARRDYPAAARALGTALRQRPENDTVRSRLGAALRLTGAYEAAVDVLREAANPAARVRLELIQTLLEMGQMKEAEQMIASWSPETNVDLVNKNRAQARFAALRYDHAEVARHCEAVLANGSAEDRWALTQLAQAQALSFKADEAWSMLDRASRAGRGSRNRSPLRSVMGQIVNDFRLRSMETRALSAATALPDTDAAQIAAALLAADGDGTGPAMALLTHLARAGRLDARLEGPTLEDRRIPRVIHQYWDQPTPPEDVAVLMDRWGELHPDHVCRRWTDKTAREFLSAHTAPAVLDAYRCASHVAIRSDLFRLAVLLTEGGIYVDADDFCRKRLDCLLPPAAELVLYQENLGSIGNNFIAAVPGHPILREALAQATRTILQGASEAPWLTTGPGLMTRLLGRAIALSPQLHLPNNVVVLPLSRLTGYVTPHMRTAYKQTTQHWSRAL